MSFLLPSLASSSRSAASARPLLAAASLRRSKADAKAKPAPIKKTSGPPVDLGDSSTDTLKRELYDPSRPSFTDTAPWQPHRPDVVERLAAVLPPASASAIHSTIAHAALLHEAAAGERHRLALKAKHALLFAASEELRATFPDWYAFTTAAGPGEMAANGDKNVLRPIAGSSGGRVEGLFPLEMRVPTDSPGRNGWDYEWSPAGAAGEGRSAE